MPYSQNDKTLALAGIYQSAILVKEIATTGNIADAQLASLLETLFHFDIKKVLDVYGDISTIKKGLTSLYEQLDGSNKSIDMDITRYVIQLLHLQKKLSKNPKLMDNLGKSLENIQNKVDYFHVSHENIVASLADVYQQNISPVGAKIMVQGDELYLSQTKNANMIRALLFAGIRSAVLWRQCGGNRLQLLLSRKKYIDSARMLLKKN